MEREKMKKTGMDREDGSRDYLNQGDDVEMNDADDNVLQKSKFVSI